jgi:hypothetical protein
MKKNICESPDQCVVLFVINLCQIFYVRSSHVTLIIGLKVFLFSVQQNSHRVIFVHVSTICYYTKFQDPELNDIVSFTRHTYSR